MIFNPLMATSMLYWAARFKEIKIDTVRRILTDLESYPEGPISIASWRTPCHSAAEVGDVEKLKELMNDVNQRYSAPPL